MMRIILLWVMLCITHFVSGQKYFIKYLGWADWNQFSYMRKLPNGNLCLGGSLQYISDPPWWAAIVEMSPDGQLVDYQELHTLVHYDYGTWAFDCLADTCYIGGYISSLEDPNDGSGFVFKLKVGEEPVYQYTDLYPGGDWMVSCLLASSDGSVLMGGLIQQPNIPWPSAYLSKLSATGEIIWEHYFYGENGTNVVQAISKLNDSTYFASLIRDRYQGSYFGEILKFNDDGLILDMISFPDDEDFTPINIFMVEGSAIFNYIKESGDEVGVRRIELDGTTIWDVPQVFVDGGQKISVDEENGYIYSTGFSNRPNVNSGRDFSLAKLDISGNLLWRRYYGDEFNNAFVENFIENGEIWTSCRSDTVGGSLIPFGHFNCMGLLTEPLSDFEFNNSDYEVSFHNTSLFVYPDSIDGGHFLWDFGDGNTSTAHSPTHSFAGAGSYLVSLTGIVCSDTSIISKCVKLDSELACDTISSNETLIVDKNYLSLYPNPSDGNAYIRVKDELQHQFEIEVFNSQGQYLFKKSYTGVGFIPSFFFELDNGLYILIIKEKNKVIKTEKLIINK